ncbi:hypothetical protein DH2020_015009 [Rehmannia glutinosa]|uniref:Uncharacterized protein n=1 Tax=Rehmannia glutinosa TaxID=99300 RepID=A0ABR0X1M1_REHGL
MLVVSAADDSPRFHPIHLLPHHLHFLSDSLPFPLLFSHSFSFFLLCSNVVYALYSLPIRSCASATGESGDKGEVQGAFYRTGQRQCQRTGLEGLGPNEGRLCGGPVFRSPEKVQEMEQRCRRGPPDAMVTGLQRCLRNDTGVGQN